MEAVLVESPRMASRAARWWIALTVAALAAGAAFRLGQFFSDQSFRADEVALLLNIVSKPLGQLFTAHLEHGQAAPPLFLAAERLVSLKLGRGELAERIIPLLFGLAALPLFAVLAWRTLPPAGAAVATALLCLSDKYIWFSAEVKQYTADVLITIILMMLFLKAVRTRTLAWFIALSLTGAAAIWLSHAGILVFAALSAAALLLLWRQNTSRARVWALLNVPFCISFLMLYVISIRHQGADAYLQDWWSDSFVDWAHPLLAPLWLLGRVRNLTSYPVSPFEWLGIIVDPLIVLGIAVWWKERRWELLTMCVGPIVATVLAAAAHKYPFSGSRVNLFLAPGLLLLAGAGVGLVGELAGRLAATTQVKERLNAGLASALMAFPLLGDIRCLLAPRNKGDMRQVVRYLKQNREPHEPVYIVRNGIEFTWYWPDAPPPIYVNQRVPQDPAPHFWVAFSYNADPHPERQLNEELGPVRKVARETGRMLRVRGGMASEFETRR